MNKTLTGVLAGLSILALPATASFAMPPIDVPPGPDDRTPQICDRDGLHEVVQRICDGIRFAGEPHFLVVKVAPNGGIRSYHLRRTATGEEILTAYPYGIARAGRTDHPREREVRMKYERLEKFWRGRPVPEDMPGSKRQPKKLLGGPGSGSGSFAASGLGLGWNPSVGPVSTECIEFTIETPLEVAVETSFSSEGQASSTAQQINISATVNEAFDSFGASDTFSYSDSYQASANSGFQYWNLANIYTLNTAATGAFTDQGTAAADSGAFSTICGSQYMTSVPAGFFATISMTWSSSSTSTSMTVSDKFTVDSGLDSLSAAASVTESSSESEESFSISMISYGGGRAAAGEKTPNQILSDAFAMKDSDDNAFVDLCAGSLTSPPAPSSDGCDQFDSAMTSGAEDASNAFTDWVNSLGPGSNLAGFQTFPSGVAGVSTSPLKTAAMPTPTDDILSGLQDELEQYTDVLNQLATLRNRADFLKDAVGKEDYNPADTNLQFDLTGPLQSLETNYDNVRSTIQSNLEKCLSASSDNVDTACKAVTDSSAAGIKTAYDWYKANNPNQLLLQNTIALQYSGIFTNNNGSLWPQDVVYVEPLPNWTINEFFLIARQAALVGFADAAFVNGTDTEQFASLTFLPLNPAADLSNFLTEVFTTQSTSPPGLWFGWFNQNPSPATNDKTQPLAWLGSTDFCFPTAEDPCDIWFGIESQFAPDFPMSFEMKAIDGLFPTTGN